MVILDCGDEGDGAVEVLEKDSASSISSTSEKEMFS